MRFAPTRIAANALAALALAAGAVGFAAPAGADSQPLQGIYRYHEEGMPADVIWRVTPTCSPTVGDLREPLYLPVGCTLHVSSNPPRMVTQPERSVAFGGDARLVQGRWLMEVDKLDGMQCADGSTAPTTEIYRFDSETLSGTRTITHAGGGGLPPDMYVKPFTLEFVEPQPIPVDRYPFYCEPAGLRACY